MSILTKPYEISVWEDVWNGEKFVEKRLGVIGSSTMNAQCRVFSPKLTQKTDGTKELSFQLYKRYIDNITGEEINNPFYDQLVNERKVKLQYDGIWYDFIIKNIQENSSTYQYTYKLENALVQELSKNGFSAEFDDSGTARELAERVLAETDWKVSESSEAFVERIEEALIYLRTEKALKAHQVIDQDVNDLKKGVEVSPNEVIIPEGKIILAFYSSCVDKPYRFQFIYVDDLSKLTKDDNRLITNENCQYIIDNPKYGEATEPNRFYLPDGLNTTTVENEIVSGKYRAKRYGFTQESVFVPVLNRYVNVYKKDGKEYYGYLNTNYVSSTLTQNYISNTQFKNTSGWTGTRFISGTPAKVESVTGRFSDSGFVNVIDEVANMSKYTYSAYMKLIIGGANSLVLNSGPRDNRLSIGRIEDGEEWALIYEAYDKTGKPISLNFDLGEYIYIPQRDKEYNFYEKVTTNPKIYFDKVVNPSQDNNVQVLFKAVHGVNNLTEKWFKENSEIRLAITAEEGEYYIKSISLFKVVRDSEGNIILPENQAQNISNQVIDTNYYFFAKENINGITNKDELIAPIVLKQMDYEQFTPKMVEGAQKIRTIQGKESNYFNLLQSIAEKFEAWLDFEINHDEYGAVLEKKIIFRNYLGKTNDVGFKYSVNLKDIQRTFESKQIVTKLIVKNNSNEFANNGFCSIAKASANPTGENYIYDFQYFFNRGMLKAKDYLNTLYVYDGASGDDILEGEEYNLKGYFPRIKAINQQIDARNEIILNLSKDITSLSAKFQIAQAGYKAAQGGLEQCNYKFQATVPTDKSIPEYLAKDADFTQRTDVQKILQEYATYQLESDKYNKECEALGAQLSDVQEKYDRLTEKVSNLSNQKIALNKLFFSTYSCYIQEGTWIEESYVDDNKYYADALSVMYHSCYPKASYTVNVLNISKLPGYEDFSYELGDKTYIEDSDFFGSDQRVEIVVTEISENLDDPSQDKIKVQTFKNQFQDLFQKITASVQSAQLKEGSYDKAVALAEAGQERKNEFVTDALAGAGARLQLAGQQSVTYGDDGLTITDIDSPSNSIRMIGGAILLSKQDKNGQTKWTTGLTSDGIAADLITAGILNVGEISIMNHNDPVFRWDSFGISAFDAEWADVQGTPVISSIKNDRFVRFDKFGIYGIDGGRNGINWYPTGKDYHGNPMEEINEVATFSLTWDGLHVKNGNARVHIGLRKDNENVESLISIFKGSESTFLVGKDGNVTISGKVTAKEGYIAGWAIDESYGIHADHQVAIVNPSTAAEGLKRFSPISSTEQPMVFYAHTRNPETTNPDEIKEYPNFCVLADGAMYASYGQIGNWKLSTNGLSYGDGIGSNNSFMLTPSGTYYLAVIGGSDTKLTWAITIDSNFGITTNGQLYATAAKISGDITANSGTVGDFSIGSIRLKGGNNFYQSLYYGLADADSDGLYEINSDSFILCPSGIYVYSSPISGGPKRGYWKIAAGNNFGVTRNGALYASAGKIGGLSIGTNELKYTNNTNNNNSLLFSINTASGLTIGDSTLDNQQYFNVDNNGVIKCFQIYTANAEIYSDGVTSEQTKTYTVSSCEGSIMQEISGGTMFSATVTVNDKLIRNQTFSVKVTAKSATGVVLGSVIVVVTIMAGSNQGTGYTAVNTSYSGSIIVEASLPSSSLSSFTQKVTYPATELRGKWKLGDGSAESTFEVMENSRIFGTDDSVVISSDRALKENFLTFSETEEVFYDSLKPITYNMKNQTNKIHFGFVAQEVQESFRLVEKDPENYALLAKGRPGYLALSYNQFIALNTWQIQKLKPRMTAAEQEIEKLKLEIVQLREELENLQNS